MKLLVFTQAVDLDNPVLGFFHRWLELLSARYESLEVVCLFEGRHALPPNVRVHSLGKEGGRSRVKYAWRFYRYLFTLSYDAVFVHMNQEYVLMGGPIWRLTGKRVYLWRNTYAGSVFTEAAMRLSSGLFCTSKSAYIAKSKKTVLMPVGIDTERFAPDPRVPRVPRSILSLGRIAPSKRLDVLVEALGLFAKRGAAFSADIYGDALPEDAAYLAKLKARAAELGLAERVAFHPGVPNRDTPDLYRAHELFVNLSPSGMYDKTIFEAAACGALSVASSRDFAASADLRLSFPEGDAGALAERLEALLASTAAEKAAMAEALSALTDREHSLAALVRKLEEAIH